MIRGIFTVLVGVFIGACATVPPSQDQERVEALIDVLNEGNADRMVDHTARPFLFDSEIVPLSNDVYVLWRNAFNAGFSLPNATIESLEVVDSETYTRYRDSPEVEAYFRRTVPEGATVARIQAQHGTFELILGDERNSLPAVYGLRGPL